MRSPILLGAMLLLLAGAPADAKELKVAAGPAMVQSGLLDWLKPRFRFKTRITLVAVPMDQADIALFDRAAPPTRAKGVAVTPIADRGEARFGSAVLTKGEAGAAAKKFVSWLISDAGRRAITSFKPQDGVSFSEPGKDVVLQQIESDGDAHIGEKLALQHCGRCHVINEKNRMGGIGSTPSFAALRAIPDHPAKFEAFWTLNPHPSFTQVEGITPPFDDHRRPHIAPIYLTLEEVEAINAYAATIKPKDLGGPVKAQ